MFKVITFVCHKTNERKSEIYLGCMAKYKVSSLLREGSFILSVVDKSSIIEAREYKERSEIDFN